MKANSEKYRWNLPFTHLLLCWIQTNWIQPKSFWSCNGRLEGKKSAPRASKYDTFGGQHCAQNWVKNTRIHICTCNSHRYPEHSPQDKSSLLSCSRDTPIYFHIRLHLALLASLPGLYYLLAQVRLSWTDPSWELLFVPLAGCSTAGWYSEFGLTLW